MKSALDPTDRETTLHSAPRALIAAIPANGVSRFVGISEAGTDVAGDQKADAPGRFHT